MSELSTNNWLEIRHGEAWLGGAPVLHDINLDLKLGESTTVLGPNGAGKSCLVKLIDRSLHPIVQEQAYLHLFGRSTVNLWQLRQRLGVVSTPMEERIPGAISGLDVVLAGFFGSTRLGLDQNPSSEQRIRAIKVLEQLDLQAISDHPYGRLSDGQRRRLLIARALVHEPDVLVLDEPSRALDLKGCHQLMHTLRDLCRHGTTLVQVTHRIDTIIPEMKRVLFLDKGRIVGDGTPAEMLTSTKLSALYGTSLTVVEAHGFRQVLPAEARLISAAIPRKTGPGDRM
ncbi:MAG: ATP-binding cassette domain-containing protein [Synechococcus sp. SP1 MAG]|nr:ATP-binding cassette domain-containing protein [Synechococcus sp. SP1 MAG]